MTRSRNVGRSYRQPPVGGLDFRVPTGALSSQYAAFMLNFHAQNGRLVKRAPHTEVVDDGQNDYSNPMPFFDGLEVIPITVGPISTHDDSSSVTNGGDFEYYSDHTVFKDSIHIPQDASGSTNVQVLDPSALTYSTGITFTANSTGVRRGICSYRERLYISDGVKIHYGGVGSTTGSTTAFDISALINGNAIGIEEMSSTTGSSLESLLVVASDKGDVLIFSGANPGAPDWQLVYKFNITISPASTSGANSIACELIKVPGDILVSTKTDGGIYSVRQAVAANRAIQYEPAQPLKHLVSSALNEDVQARVFMKTVAYWAERNSLVVHARLDTTYINYLNEWSAYFGDPMSLNVEYVLFIIDLTDGHIEMHTYPVSGFLSAITDRNPPLPTLRIVANVILSGVYGGSIRLFDATAYRSSVSQDYDTDDITAAVVLAPPNDLGYRLKALKSLVLYANTHNSHNVQHGIRTNFQTAPADSYQVVDSTVTDTTIKSHVLPGNEINHAPMVSIIEDGSHSTPFEFHGLDMIFEEGGEY